MWDSWSWETLVYAWQVDDIQKQLKEINWYRIEDKTFTFRVWTQLKFDEKVKDFGYKIIQ